MLLSGPKPHAHHPVTAQVTFRLIARERSASHPRYSHTPAVARVEKVPLNENHVVSALERPARVGGACDRERGSRRLPHLWMRRARGQLRGSRGAHGAAEVTERPRREEASMGDVAPTPRCSDGFGSRPCPSAILGLRASRSMPLTRRSELMRRCVTTLIASLHARSSEAPGRAAPRHQDLGALSCASISS